MSVRSLPSIQVCTHWPSLIQIFIHKGVRALDRQTLICCWMAIARVPFGKSSQKATSSKTPCTGTKDHGCPGVHRPPPPPPNV
ncbi:hypothetical protein Hanom_Chr12g01107491 [Helianthus anomalus]